MMLCRECDCVVPVPGLVEIAQADCPNCGARYEVTVKMLQPSPLGEKELAEKRNRNR